MDWDELSPITDSIFISNWNGSVSRHRLVAANIKFILCLNHAGKKDRFQDMYEELGIKHKYIVLEDVFNADFRGKIPDIVEFMLNEQHGSVLVHCSAGISRSCAAVVAFFLYKIYHMTRRTRTDRVYDRLVQFVSGARPICDINYGFVDQLKAYETQLAINLDENQLIGGPAEN